MPSSCEFQQLLPTIISLLPRYSEEGSQASRINKQELLAALEVQFGTAQLQSITTLLYFIERIFTSLSLLHTEELKHDTWQFVSHPAQLCALSLLHIVADSEQRLFSSEFWHTAGVGEVEKQQQKQVLQVLEDQRYAQHRQHQAQPIRYVYVAWAIIKLENKILLHQREATEHATEYGLIGGRANMRDLKQVLGEDKPTHELLCALQAADSPPMWQALENTLQRECEEEIKLFYSKGHYVVTPWRDLTPWRGCMGAAPNYALTEYFFRLYHLQLTTTGYFVLRHRLQQDNNRFIECSLDEIAGGKTSDGAKTLRIEAMYQDFANDRQALVQALQDLPSSYINSYTFQADKDSLTFFIQRDIEQGEAGKEKPVPFTVTLEQKSWLLGLAAHAKGFSWEQINKQNITLHPHGWIEVHTHILQQVVAELSETLRKQGLPLLEVLESRYVRLAVAPELIFLEPGFFSYDVQQLSKYQWQWQLQRQAIPTPLGVVAGDTRIVELNSSIAMSLNAADGLDEDEDKNLPKKIRSSLQESYQALGLKRFLLIRDKKYRLSCRQIKSLTDKSG